MFAKIGDHSAALRPRSARAFLRGVNRYLITAFASLLPDGGLPDEIVYLPEGNHAITPFVDGKPKKITVRVPAAKGAQIAASLQADLEKRQAGNVRPWFDFEH